MTDPGRLFLNTPLPYLGAMYFLAYRHDLGIIARPFHDLSDSSEWYAVFKRLDLGGTRNLLLAVVSIAIYVVPIFTSFLLAGHYRCATQAAVAMPLFVLLVTNRTGPSPFRPYRNVLPCPRLGNRIGGLSGREEPKPDHPDEPAVSTTGAKP